MLRLVHPSFLVLAFAHSLLAQTPAKSPDKSVSTQKPPGNCTVSGRVLSAVDGAPLRSAHVGLIESQNRKHPLVYGATTHDQGRFEIKQVDANTYTFFASHPGYLEQRYKAKGTNREDDGVA